MVVILGFLCVCMCLLMIQFSLAKEVLSSLKKPVVNSMQFRTPSMVSEELKKGL